MLYRKIESEIREHLLHDKRRMLIVDGARQVGKSYIIRHVGKQLFAHYVEINMEEDKLGDRLFADARTVADFYLALSSVAGNKLHDQATTLVFIDEIQAYPHLLTLAKFLMADARFTYVASGSLLGVTLQETQSIPLGSIRRLHMYPLDFEEFLLANGVGSMVIDAVRQGYALRESLSEPIHRKLIDLLRKYLLVGGMPDCVNIFVTEQNIARIRDVQREIHDLYSRDAAKYEAQSGKQLKIRRIYDLLPSNLENKKKRLVVKKIEGKTGKRMADYQDEFDYLISSGIALDVKAISQPTFPLVQNMGKNLLKLYFNDVGIFSGLLYGTNIKAVLDDSLSINLGSLYENLVAQELKAHGFGLYYYDNKQHGEVDYLIDDTSKLAVTPIEVKSGKDYMVHSALSNLLKIENYPVNQAIVLSNEREVKQCDGITYLPIYYVMCITKS